MQLDFKVRQNPALYLKDPESTEVGKSIVTHSIKMIYEIGYEKFTFKKVAQEIPTTEATVYRYFENKHRLLIYLIDLYWSFMEFQVMFHLNNVPTPEEKIKKIIDILVWEDNVGQIFTEFDQKSLYYIAISESSKTYLSKDVDENNKEMLFKPYKDLCASIASVFSEYNPDYPYARSLASSIIEISHFQYFFMHHLPRLCDFSKNKNPKELEAFLESVAFNSLKP
ncbi:MAG: TetR/AcrR family transcriptional regulator [Cytophagales bacterium]|nr:TetR/AcrR family transcriptional regulator [Cytophagales bacterium]